MSSKKKRNNKPAVNTAKTVTEIKKQNTFEYILTNILCLLVFVAFGYIAIMSFIQTCTIDSAHYASEKILFNTDNLVLNTFFTVFLYISPYFFAKLKQKVTSRFLQIVNLLFLKFMLLMPTESIYHEKCLKQQ